MRRSRLLLASLGLLLLAAVAAAGVGLYAWRCALPWIDGTLRAPGLPASPHYADPIALWHDGRTHPAPRERDEPERLAEGRLVLTP